MHGGVHMDQFPTSRLALLTDPLFVLWLLFVAFFVGARVFSLLTKSEEATPLERTLLSLLLGLGLLEYIPFGLGMAEALTPTNLWIASLLLTAYAAFEAARAFRLRRGFPSSQHEGRPWSSRLEPDLWVFVAISGITLLLSVVIAVAPPTDPDGLFYHLTAPKRWLQSGSLRYLPSFVHTNGPMGGQMYFTWAMALWSDTSTKLIHFSFGAISLLSIVAIGLRIGTLRAGIMAAALWLLGLNVLGTLGATTLFSMAYVDLNLAAFSLGSVLALLCSMRSGDYGYAIIAALSAGFALTTKLTGLFVGGSLTAFVAFMSFAERAPLSVTVRKTFTIGVLALLPGVPWFLRSWIQTGSPIYLMLPSVFETKDWSPEAGRAFSDFFKYYVWGTGSSARDWSLALRKGIRLGALGGLLLGFGFWIWRVKRAELRLPLFIFFGVALGSIAGTGLYLRYLVPFSGLVFVVLFARLPERLLAHRIATVAFAALLAVNLAQFLRTVWPSPGLALRVSLGLESREDFLRQGLGERTYELFQEVNTRARKGEVVLLAAGRPSYYMDPYCFITEAYYQERLRMDTWEHYLADVRRDGFSYLIVPLKMDRSNATGPAYAAADNEMPFARRLAAEYGEKIGNFGNDDLYRLRF